MMDALRALGAIIHIEPAADPGNVDVQVIPIGAGGVDAHIDAGLAGTVMRFIPAVAGLVTGSVTIDGDAEARIRPMGATVDALRQLGVTVNDTTTLPLHITGNGFIRGGTVRIDASASSQFVSALLLVGARTKEGLRIEHTGDRVPSAPHIAMTLAMLEEHGVPVETTEPNTWVVSPSVIAPVDRIIEPDLSNAAPFMAAALVTRGTVRIQHWPHRTTQAGDALRGLLSDMGADISFDDTDLVVSMTGRIQGLNVDLHDVGELTPTIAALAALAEHPSHLTGIAHLRGHETDRIAALVTEIRRLGGIADELPDGISIHPSPLHGGIVHTYADHRMATAGAVLGLRVHGVSVEDITVTEKTLPDFPRRWAELLAGTDGT